MDIDASLAHKLGLSDSEYERVLEILGRTPTYSELGVFSVMWSEHCSYKSSKRLLRTFPNESPRLLAAPGAENAGALAIDDNYAVVFKVESHNHPSAIEPFEGAATGVGGILRDIFAMGARPVAVLDALRFGNLKDPKVQHLFQGVVAGIASYGNCFGVPTVGGDIYFDPVYSVNPIVNVMAVGLVRRYKIATAIARGKGNPVIYVGSATGRDGIHGATFASDELTASSHKDRPSVQIGDPFTEKLLMEATLEVISEDLVVGVQDMGAAGLTSSSVEMAAKGSSGLALYLDRVPMREDGMTPYELLLSESQERMLFVAKAGKTQRIKEILDKWELNYAEIGEVTDTGRYRCYWHNELVVDIPVDAIGGEGVPQYDMPAKIITTSDEKIELSEPQNMEKLLLDILAHPTVASNKWVYRQYDHQVGTNTVMLPGAGDAAVLRIKGSNKFIALSIDGNGAYCTLDPYEGAKAAVAEAARNVAATGATPIGITNCLNYGNPQKPAVFGAFAEGVRGIGDACRAFDIPVTGGNVSFYNESPKGAVHPSPIIGMVGIIENENDIIPMAFQQNSDAILLIGETKNEIEGSIYQEIAAGKITGKPPEVDLNAETKALELILSLNKMGLIHSCHDISEGGLWVALAEAAMLSDKVGADIELPNKMRTDIFLLSESQGRYLTSCPKEKIDMVLLEAKKSKTTATLLGHTTSYNKLRIGKIELDIEKLKDIYYNSLEENLR